MKNNKGFSLVELIIVIAIMAILAGALAPALIKYINKSRKSTDVSNAQTVATAVTTALANEEAFNNLPAVGIHKLGDIAKTGGNAFENELADALHKKVPTPKYQKGDFYIQIEDADGNFKVLANDKSTELYPDVDPSYK